jgi:hypothetical protein
LRHDVKDFLGIEIGVKLSIFAVIGSLLCVFSGILLIILESAYYFAQTSVFASIFDPSILCGLLIMVGGVLILLRSSILGAAMSIIFGLFPPPSNVINGFPAAWGANHVFNIIPAKLNALPFPLVALIAVMVGSLPIIGGLMALASTWKTRR